MKKDIEWMGNSSEALAFVRVSSHRQKDNSPDVQKREIEDYCQRNDLCIVSTRSIIESAKDSDDREKYRESIDSAIKQGIRHIVFYMTDREGRNLTDVERSQKLIKSGKIVVHYVRDNKVLHKGSDRGAFLMRRYQAIHDAEVSEVISLKVNDAMRRKAEDGWFPNNHAPLGYRHEYLKDDSGRSRKRGTIIVRDSNPAKVNQVIREFELAAKGYSVASIRQQVIDEGLIQPSQTKKYSKHGIEARLKNKFYRGKFDWQGVEYQGRHEIIIPKHLLDSVDGRFGFKKIRRKPTEEQGALAGGWIRCGHPECGLQITCEHTKKKIKATGETKEYRHYRCSNSRGIHKSQKGSYVSEEKLLKAFEPALNKVALTEAQAAQIADAMNEADRVAKATIQNEMNRYRKALDSLHARRLRYLDMVADNQISTEDYRLKLNEIEADVKHFTKLLEDAQYQISDAWKETAESILELAKQAKELWNQGTLTEKVEILKKVCWNPILEGANLRYDLQKPFATIAKITESVEWRPHGDLNPSIHRERVMS